MAVTLKVKYELDKLSNNPKIVLMDKGVNTELQSFFANTMYRHMTPYVPMDTGMLMATADISADDDHGEIHYTQKYAHYVYTNGNGKGLHFQTTHHPLATAYWDKAMWAVDGDTILEEVDAFRRRISK